MLVNPLVFQNFGHGKHHTKEVHLLLHTECLRIEREIAVLQTLPSYVP